VPRYSLGLIHHVKREVTNFATGVFTNKIAPNKQDVNLLCRKTQ